MGYDLSHLSYEVAKEWTGLVTGSLKLQTSDKNRFLPPGQAAEAAIAGCRIHHCTAKIVDHERDLGIDAVGTCKRNGEILHKRADDAKGRAGRNVFVINTVAATGAGIKYVRKAQMMARQGMNHSQVYGSSAIGATPQLPRSRNRTLPSRPVSWGKVHRVPLPFSGPSVQTRNRTSTTRCRSSMFG